MPPDSPTKRFSPKLGLYSCLLVFVIVSAGVWRVWPDIGANLFAESIGIVAVALVIDKFNRLENDRKERPARLAAFRDAMETSHEAREFALSLARTSVTANELSRVTMEKSCNPEKWLVTHFARIKSQSIAPFVAVQLPDGRVENLTWGQTMEGEINKIRELIVRYLQRHTAHGDPEITEAVHNLEENGLFRSMSYGSDMFWRTGLHLEGMYSDFLAKLSKLIAVTRTYSARYAGDSNRLKDTDFAWHRLRTELEENPIARPQAPWRPTG